ncbi:hypothetical protein DFH05DRAFT_1459319 [Lentinula detonsa]|uniref:Uncharacterized protein n=1 Tax=Lentinula detonsa TaxID=2804962 RepID=A0A9W8P292_9AGAR|nr:hypothetical protein DFH05DRAFT_1459319 [Lentinula detonsa]
MEEIYRRAFLKVTVRPQIPPGNVSSGACQGVFLAVLEEYSQWINTDPKYTEVVGRVVKYQKLNVFTFGQGGRSRSCCVKAVRLDLDNQEPMIERSTNEFILTGSYTKVEVVGKYEYEMEVTLITGLKSASFPKAIFSMS